jgi:ribosome maturation factor RimP
MSGSSRHGTVRPSAAAGSRPGSSGGRSSQSRQRKPGGPGAATVDADRVADLLGPVVSAVGMDLEGVRITAAGRRRLLRIVVDADGGVSLDDIARASRELAAALDDATVMGDLPYTLEVSSPGVDRPLTERRHWRRAIGRLVLAPLTAPAAGGEAAEAVVEGRVTGASADGITLDLGGQTRQFGYGDLGPGKIKIEFAPIDGGSADEDAAGEDPDDEGADEEGSGGY